MKECKKVLIVDDEEDIAQLLEIGLGREGYEVVCVYDGQEAKEKIIQENPDIVLLDLMMPGINGWQVLEWMRKDKNLSTPVIIISARDEMQDIKKSYNLEADHYLVKPIKIKDVINGIQAVCLIKGEGYDRGA